MQLNESLHYVFGVIRDHARRVVEGLPAGGLTWRADEEANSVAWLVWHLARVADHHVAEIAGRPQVWVAGGWPRQLGLPPDYQDTGYGHSAAQVAEIAPEAGPLLGYLDAVTEMVREFLDTASAEDFDRVIDRSYDPPVTVGVRFASVVDDACQHVGQAAFVRGLHQRSG